MNNQSHLTAPKAGCIGKLDKTSRLEHSSRTIIFEPKDLVAFQDAWKWQQEWQKSLLNGETSCYGVWILQHKECYTLGRGASEKNLLFEPKNEPSELVRIDRGGEVTLHLPGQLVVYLVLDLRRYKTDLNWYLRELEQVIIDLLESLGLSAYRIDGLTGIWVGGYKVASLGISCRRWITQHGFALNVDCDLKGFDKIIPCGLSQHSVGKLENWIPGIRVIDVQPYIRKFLSRRFDFAFEDGSDYYLKF